MNTSIERQRRYTEKKKSLGMVRVEVWVKQENAEFIKNAALFIDSDPIFKKELYELKELYGIK